MKRSIQAAAICAAVLVLAAACSLGGGDSNDSSSGGGDGGGSGEVIKIYALTGIDGQLEALAEAYKQDSPGTTIEYTFGSAEELNQKIIDGSDADVYIARPQQTNEVRDAGKTQAEAVLLGTDVLQIATPRDNPSNVGGLDAFAAGSDTPSGLCQEKLACGRNGLKAITDVGLVPGDNQIEETGSKLLTKIIDGSLQAGILYRTQVANKLKQVTIVPLPEESQSPIDYRIVQISANESGKNFVAWTKDSKTADDTLKARGLRALLAPIDGASTTTAP